MTLHEWEEVKARARMAVAIGVVAIIVVLGSTLVANAGGWSFPNGGTLTEHSVVERPDGGHEVMPSRCLLFEDGSAICGSWEQSRDEVEAHREQRGKAEAKQAQQALTALRLQIKKLADAIADVTP